MDPLVIKQQEQEQHCCSLGRVLCTGFTPEKGWLCWGCSAMELQDKDQAKRPQDAAQVAQEECS